MQSCFLSGDFILPKTALDKWAVIACDQHTSEEAYWTAVSDFVGTDASALSYIQPECIVNTERTHFLESDREGFFQTYSDCFVYVEREMRNGTIRKGIVGLIDLDHYYTDGRLCDIMATEDTDKERLLQRISIRLTSPIELSHTMLLFDDPLDSLLGWVSSVRHMLRQIYDFYLMLDGGRVRGWLLDGALKDAFLLRIDKFYNETEQPHFLVGDGNHSVASAKACYTAEHGSSRHRYTMVELVNIHAPAVRFLPIHRLVKNCDDRKLISYLNTCFSDGDLEIPWYTAHECGAIHVDGDHLQAIRLLQKHLDAWLSQNQGDLDYIHGDDTLKELAIKEKTLGFVLPGLDKGKLFSYIREGKILPRKSFSIGHACEKRYYLEGRRIK